MCTQFYFSCMDWELFDQIRSLEDRNALNIPDKNGDTILHKLLKDGNANIAERLNIDPLKHFHLDFDIKDRNGRTGLFILLTTDQKLDSFFPLEALRRFIHRIITTLLADILISELDKIPKSRLKHITGSELDTYYYRHRTMKERDPFHYVLGGSIKVEKAVEWIARHKRDAAIGFSGDMQMIDSSDFLNIRELDYAINGNALHYLASVNFTESDNTYGIDDAIQFFIVNGVDINAKNEAGKTPIQMAAKFNNKLMVDAYMDYGANYNIDNLIEIVESNASQTNSRTDRLMAARRRFLLAWLNGIKKATDSAISWIALNNRNALNPKLSESARDRVAIAIK